MAMRMRNLQQLIDTITNKNPFIMILNQAIKTTCVRSY